jgi:hypothetical protein
MIDGKNTSKGSVKSRPCRSFLRTKPIKIERKAFADGEMDRASLKDVEDKEIEKLFGSMIYECKNTENMQEMNKRLHIFGS